MPSCFATSVTARSLPSAGKAASMLVNIRALIAVHRSFLAQLRGDAEDTAAFAMLRAAGGDAGRRPTDVIVVRDTVG